MKKLFTVMIFGLILSACDSSSHKKTTYSITDWVATMPTNIQTMDAASGWVRMVIYKDSVQYKEDTASNGDVTKKKSVVSDTFYFVRTADLSCPYKDSTGKQINDPNTHQPIYFASWRNAGVIPKDVVKPEFPIPAQYLPRMLAAIPQPDTTYRAPNMHIVSKDTARHSGK